MQHSHFAVHLMASLVILTICSILQCFLVTFCDWSITFIMSLRCLLFQCAHHDAVGQSSGRHLAFKKSCYSNCRRLFGVLCKIDHLTKSQVYVCWEFQVMASSIENPDVVNHGWTTLWSRVQLPTDQTCWWWPLTSYNCILQLIMQSPGWEAW